MLRRCIAFVMISLVAIGQASAQANVKDEPAVTAQDLLQPGFFPNASMGMKVEDATDGDTARVVTTGGEFLIDKAAGTIECRQRISKQRTVARISLPASSIKEIKLSHKSSGAAIFSAGKATIRINGDSLLMISAGVDGDITAELAFTPDYFAPWHGNFNCFDPHGGISFFDHGKVDSPKVEAVNDPVKITWSLKAGDVLWAGVSPPKPYDWEKSLKQRIVLRGTSSQEYMFPDLLTIRWLARISKFNVFYLHAENIWTNWQADFVPRNETEYLRVMRQAAAEGMPVMVYASPKHFVTGTPRESMAVNDVDDPRAGGWSSGANAKLFVYQAKRLKDRFETGGLYFDEMYCSPKALSANYYVARSCRDIYGEDAPYVFHCTEDVMGARNPGDLVGTTNCPTVHAYFDAVYKGEGLGMAGMLDWDNVEQKFPGYIRYNMGTYNISNSIALPIFDRGPWFEGDLFDRLLARANIRVVMPEWHLYNEKAVPYWTRYIPSLTPDLKAKIEPTLLKPTGAFDRWRKSQGAAASAANADAARSQ